VAVVAVAAARNEIARPPLQLMVAGFARSEAVIDDGSCSTSKIGCLAE